MTQNLKQLRNGKRAACNHFFYNIIKREKHLNLLTGRKGVTNTANVSSYARAIACTNHTFTNSAVETNYSRVKVDTYCFERALAFVSVHPWANSK